MVSSGFQKPNKAQKLKAFMNCMHNSYNLRHIFLLTDIMKYSNRKGSAKAINTNADIAKAFASRKGFWFFIIKTAMKGKITRLRGLLKMAIAIEAPASSGLFETISIRQAE